MGLLDPFSGAGPLSSSSAPKNTSATVNNTALTPALFNPLAPKSGFNSLVQPGVTATVGPLPASAFPKAGAPLAKNSYYAPAAAATPAPAAVTPKASPVTSQPKIPEVTSNFSPGLDLPGQANSIPISSFGAQGSSSPGSNTAVDDGEGFEGFFRSLSGNTVALLGAGVVVVAVAFFFVLKK